MKTSVKISIPIIIIGIAVFSLLFIDVDFGGYSEDIVKEVQTQVEEIHEEIPKVTIPQIYDCARNFDNMMNLAKSVGAPNDANMKKIQKMILKQYDNRCFITVESWAHESNYEEQIWTTDWKENSYKNQLYLGEIEPQNKGDQQFIDNIQNFK